MLTQGLIGPIEEAEFYRLVLNNVSDSLVVVDTAGAIVLINDPYCEILGGRAEDFVGRHIVEVIGPDTKLHLVAQGIEAQVGRPLEVRGHKLVTKQVPVRRNGEIVGAVGFALFSDYELLKKTYSRIFKPELSLSQANRAWRSRFNAGDIIGEGPAMAAYRQLLEQAAQYDLPVLISGETGTGKELAAQAIHAMSDRAEGPFVWVNCASMPGDLIEAELFGYEGGAFTGARQRGKPGKFELAGGGVLLLDEIGDMPLSLQGSLLRVLQTNEVVRVGGTAPLAVNARIICATHRPLAEEVRAGRFREDLYHRLNVLPIEVPALRERGDLVFLAGRLLERISDKLGRPVPPLGDAERRLLLAHGWSGNVRELENVLTRYMVTGTLSITGKEAPVPADGEAGAGLLKQRIRHLAASELRVALAQAQGNKIKAAELLGISRSHLYRLLAAHGLGKRGDAGGEAD